MILTTSDSEGGWRCRRHGREYRALRKPCGQKGPSPGHSGVPGPSLSSILFSPQWLKGPRCLESTRMLVARLLGLFLVQTFRNSLPGTSLIPAPLAWAAGGDPAGPEVYHRQPQRPVVLFNWESATCSFFSAEPKTLAFYIHLL